MASNFLLSLGLSIITTSYSMINAQQANVTQPTFVNSVFVTQALLSLMHTQNLPKKITTIPSPIKKNEFYKKDFCRKNALMHKNNHYQMQPRSSGKRRG